MRYLAMFNKLRGKERKTYEDGLHEGYGNGYDKGFNESKKIAEELWLQYIKNMAKAALIDLATEFKASIKVVREEPSSYRLNGEGTMEIKEMLKLETVVIRISINPDGPFMCRIKKGHEPVESWEHA